jgi:hypothetical protein
VPATRCSAGSSPSPVPQRRWLKIADREDGVDRTGSPVAHDESVELRKARKRDASEVGRSWGLLVLLREVLGSQAAVASKRNYRTPAAISCAAMSHSRGNEQRRPRRSDGAHSYRGIARRNVANVRSSRLGRTDREPVYGAQLEAQLLKALALNVVQ